MAFLGRLPSSLESDEQMFSDGGIAEALRGVSRSATGFIARLDEGCF
jgi:hypothetical protein